MWVIECKQCSPASSGITWGNDCKVAFSLFLPFCYLIVSVWPCPVLRSDGESLGRSPPAASHACFPCPLTMPTRVTDELLQEAIRRDSSRVPCAPAAWRSPSCFHRTALLSETALLCDSLLGKEMSQEFLAVRRVTGVHISSLTPTQISSRGGGPALRGSRWDSHSEFCSHAGFSLFVMDAFQGFNFKFLNHLWRRKNGVCFVWWR